MQETAICVPFIRIITLNVGRKQPLLTYSVKNRQKLGHTLNAHRTHPYIAKLSSEAKLIEKELH